MPTLVRRLLPASTQAPAAPPKPAAPRYYSFRTIADINKTRDLEQVLNLSKLYAMTIDTSLDEFRDRMGVFHPSSVGRCKREQVMAFVCTPPSDRQSKRVKEIFKMGHVIHDVVQSALKRLPEAVKHLGLNVHFEDEVPVDKENDTLWREYKIAGTCDGLLEIWNAQFEQRSVVEIKSSGDEKFKEVVKMEEGFEAHLMQSHLYAFRHDRPIIYVFYYNKNKSTREVKPTFFQPEIFEKALAYFDDCKDYADRGELPAREESYFGCKDCVYRTMCDPVTLRGKSSYDAPPPKLQLRRRLK